MTLSDLWRIIRQKPKIETVKKAAIGKSDEEKALELEERKNEIELNRLKINELKRARFKKELDDVASSIEYDTQEEEDDGEDFDDEDIPPWLAPFMPIIAQKIGQVGKQATNSQESQTGQEYPQDTATPQTYTSIPDEEIRNALKAIPKNQLKMAKVMPKSALYNMVNQKMPMSPHDFERAYQILVTEF